MRAIKAVAVFWNSSWRWQKCCTNDIRALYLSKKRVGCLDWSHMDACETTILSICVSGRNEWKWLYILYFFRQKEKKAIEDNLVVRRTVYLAPQSALPPWLNLWPFEDQKLVVILFLPWYCTFIQSDPSLFHMVLKILHMLEEYIHLVHFCFGKWMCIRSKWLS